MEEAVKLSTQMRWLSPLSWCLCGRALSCKERTSSIGKLGFTSNYNLFGPMKERLKDKHYPSDEKIKTAMIKWLKERPAEFYESVIYALIRKGKIPIKINGVYVEKKGCDQEMTSFILKYEHVLMSVIIPALKIKELFLLYNCGRIFFILSFFVLHILPFGLVRLRTFRLSAWIS